MHDALLSRTVDVAAIPAAGRAERIEATPAERAAIAEAYGLLDVKALSAELTLKRSASGAIAVTGDVGADIVQSCVVSFVPVEQRIDEPVDLRFAPEGSAEAPEPPRPGAEIMIQRDAEDPPEIYSGPTLDIGAVALEHFILAIDPYPRAPGAELPAEAASGAEEPLPSSPFAVLKRLSGEG